MRMRTGQSSPWSGSRCERRPAPGPFSRRQPEPAGGERGVAYFSRRAFSVTVIEDSDMASAASSGVASPMSANGTATAL